MEEHAGELCDYTLVSELGSGSSGVVILGKHKLTKAKVQQRGDTAPRRLTSSSSQLPRSPSKLYIVKKTTVLPIRTLREKLYAGHASKKSELNPIYHLHQAFLSLLNHPNIIRLDEVRTREQTVYLIMEYFEGDELFSTISRRALSERRFRPLFRQMVDALAYAHNRNISHRDLKPENILVDQVSAIFTIDSSMTEFRLCVSHARGADPECDKNHRFRLLDFV